MPRSCALASGKRMMRADEYLLSIRDLRVVFRGREDLVAVDGVSFDLRRGESLGLVGESGCGKSTVALSIVKLVRPPGVVASGEVRFHGVDLLRAAEDELQRVRGSQIALVFQDPTASLNPLVRLATHLAEETGRASCG